MHLQGRQTEWKLTSATSRLFDDEILKDLRLSRLLITLSPPITRFLFMRNSIYAEYLFGPIPPFMHKSSDYAILSKNLLFSSSKHFTSEPVSQTERRLARGEVHGSIYNTVPTENLAHFSCPSPIDIHD